VLAALLSDFYLQFSSSIKMELGSLEIYLSQAAIHWPRTSLPLRRIEYPAGWPFVHGLERIAAGVLLIACVPLLAVAALAVIALSGKSPLVAHRRVGRYGASLWVLKLRTMWQADDKPAIPRGLIEHLAETDVPEVKAGTDPRVTSRFATFLRKFSIDELPQLLHVLRGEMSLVGPRPLTRAELAKYYGEYATEIIQIQPGLTGLWQVRGRNRLSYRQRRRLDLFLVRRFGWILYLKVLLCTPARVLTGRDAW
jgi:exopolysaccharide production protein ExoY